MINRDCSGTFADVRALTFDVFGTVVDWRSSIVREGAALRGAQGRRIDWGQLADAWRAGYAPAMEEVRSGRLPWMSLDELHRRILGRVLERFGLGDLPAAEVEHLNQAWHRLTPWPDAVGGLNRLRGRYVLATLSNGNVSLLVDMAKHTGLPWDLILSAELARHYKPDAEVYHMAARLLSLPAHQIMMVAAHPGDLSAAKRVGFRTAYVPRPLEFGSGQVEPEVAVDADITAADFFALADRLGA